MSTSTSDVHPITDRFAIVDLINSYFAATDAKEWDFLKDHYADDAVAWWTAQKFTTGRDAILDYTSSMLGTDEIVTHHTVASFTPVIDGDTAQADVRVRAMHNGVGSRAGRFWESLVVQNTEFVRTSDGWRIKEYKWNVVVGLGSLDLFDGLWIQASTVP